MGVGLNDKVVPAVDFFKSLEAHNRDIIDPISNRYFFVWNPVKISVKNAPEQSVSIPLHPDNKQKGKRVFKTKTDFFVPKDDLAKVKVGKLYRLMDCLNFTKKAKEFLFDSTDYAVFREKGAGTMHWIPAEADAVDVEVLMPDNKVKKGIGEPILRDLDVGTIVQLERFGFCRLDKKENNKIAFWFAHR